MPDKINKVAAEEKADAAVNIFERSVAVAMTIGKTGIMRKVSTDKIDVKDMNGDKEDVDKSLVKVSAEILKCKEFDRINSLDNGVRLALGKLALPAPFRRGVYLIPLTLLDMVDALFNKYTAEREEAVKAFCDAYMMRKIEAKEKLGSLYNEAHYPALDRVRESFYVRVNYLSLGVPSALNEISPEVYRRERDRFNAQLTDAAEEVKAALREGFGALVASMVEKLKDKDGSRQIFRDSLVNNLRDFMEVFEARNIANDADLAALVGKARALLDGGIDAKVLRDNDGLRQSVQSGFAEVAATLETIKAPRRKFDFDGE